MKKYEYKEISLGGATLVNSEREQDLTVLGKQGWRLVSTFLVQHHNLPNTVELRAFLEREELPILG